ncbi:PilZ domain-containing protein [Roseateles puraquae]|uniref:PilZ domain-containing protein n=1 Tax=Roseateles puraquae TaxID=431059 RepID=A0A254N476_9BURK|nr:PilZ domain-containing protein [Roseateles puraquae]MDG0856928.1 PilZ domain-containing protein [Roseateles puraquae]OWR02454.1 hypothetical protein CDO81_19915 [Roseateles puraquae]
MSASEEAERRTAERKGLRTRATLLLGQTQAFEVRTLDLASGGMGIVAQANPRPGTVMVIRFQLPIKPMGYVPIEARARVVHSVYSASEQGFKIGLAFIEIRPDAAAAVLRYVQP